MPIYEYCCHNCSNEFEELVGISEPPPECPKCNSGNVIRLLSTPSFSLKGEGWYSDHYGLKGEASSDTSKPEVTDNATDGSTNQSEE
jgi:putative FmdB family regulatory protein